MKKIFLTFIIILSVFILALSPMIVSAEEEPIPEPEVAEQDAEPTLEEFKAEVQEWMSQYMEESMVIRIITWLVDAGILSALLTIYIRYKKYKHTSLEELLALFKIEMGGWLKENFDNLSKEQTDKVVNSIDKLENAVQTIMKVLVLMQDNTAQGKIALMEYLGAKTNSEEVKKAVAEVNETLEAQEKVNAEIKAKVAGEYEEIF